MHEITKKSEFLQSQCWREFQESVGQRTFSVESRDFSASIIQHVLPIVGKYFYCPRGPVASAAAEEFPISNLSADKAGFQIPDKSQFLNDKIKSGMQELVELARKNNAGWIRIEPNDDNFLNLIKENIAEKIVRAPHDMQPKEIFAIDITKNHEQLLSEMKPKTRYNVGVAKKRGVVVSHQPPASTRGDDQSSSTRGGSAISVDAFLKLTKEMAARNGIAAHSENYCKKMIESFSDDMLKIYVAEYEGNIIAANLVLFFGKTATYLHGASGNEFRNVMAPFLLQWQAILDAKEKGCEVYDFGGVQTATGHQMHSDLVGVTNFKMGFSPSTIPIEFPGSYDIVINPRAYALYRGLQRAKAMMKFFKK